MGPYEIVSAIGAGGMGEVYRARDTKLDRDVAIKILPEIFALDPDRRTRFEREAKTLAALNHPNIAQIYGIESNALVMELVEGEDLSATIARGPLPLDDALAIARQIADALEAAHEQGIVHRDLKPANVKVRADGRVKVLDFGLAKAVEPPDPSGVNAMNSPTLTVRGTQMGVIVGTAAYMAPEQARGKSVDKRADVWAFGAVLYEMLAGRQAFAGDTITDIIAAVITRDPDWTAIPASTPPPILQLLARCLDKDPRRRLRDIGDARFVLESGRPQSGASVAMGAPPAVSAAVVPPRPWGWMAGTAVCAAAAVVLGITLWRGRAAREVADTFELAIAPPAGAEFQIGANLGNVIVSPDGTRVAFVASTTKATTLWVRSLGSDDARSLSGTDGASYPFWSPDSTRLGFFANAKLRTVDIAGGLPEVIADAPAGRGGAWTDDGTILFTPNGGQPLFKVGATGGAVTPLTKFDVSRGENAHYWPVALPGGTRFIYFARSAQTENAGIYLARVDGSAPPIRVVASMSSGIVVSRPSTGEPYLIWVRDGDLLAQPFDTESGALRGQASTIARGVRVEESQRLSFASASRTGVVAWAAASAADAVFALYTRDGRRVRALDIPPAANSEPVLSPDGRRILYLHVEKGLGAIYLHDLESGATQRVSTTPGYVELPSWSRDGRGMYYLGSRNGERYLDYILLDSGAQAAAVVKNIFNQAFETPGGQFVVYTAIGANTGLDVMAVPLSGSRTPVPLAATAADETVTSMSADGRWLTIASSQNGGSNAIHQLITTGGTPKLGGMFPLGSDPGARLRDDAAEAFLVTADGSLKSVSVTRVGGALTLGPPKTLFSLPTGDGTFGASAHGDQFVVTELPFAKGQALRVLTNWEKRLGR